MELTFVRTAKVDTTIDFVGCQAPKFSEFSYPTARARRGLSDHVGQPQIGQATDNHPVPDDAIPNPCFDPVQIMPIPGEEFRRVMPGGACLTKLATQINETLTVACGRVVPESPQIVKLPRQHTRLLAQFAPDTFGRILPCGVQTARKLVGDLANRVAVLLLQQDLVALIEHHCRHADAVATDGGLLVGLPIWQEHFVQGDVQPAVVKRVVRAKEFPRVDHIGLSRA